MDAKKARTLDITGVTGLLCTTKNNTMVELGAIELIVETIAVQRSTFYKNQSYRQSYCHSNNAALPSAVQAITLIS